MGVHGHTSSTSMGVHKTADSGGGCQWGGRLNRGAAAAVVEGGGIIRVAAGGDTAIRYLL